jgi:hypothetical protein
MRMRYPARVLNEARMQVRAVVRAQGRHHARLRDRVAAILFATLGIDLVSAALAYMFEHGQKGTQIHAFGDAIFWTSTQLLTVSSQLPNPISTGARILDVFMEAWAVTVVASLAAAVGAFFVHIAAESAHDQSDPLGQKPAPAD